MDELKDRHFGEVGLIIGNGPSLKNVSLDFLKKYTSFGSNRIYILFVPNYYVCIDPTSLRDNYNEIGKLKSTKFIRAGWGVDGYELHSLQKPSFSLDPLKGVYEGWTVTYIALQLAYYMGFSTVLLVGVDHRYNASGKPRTKMFGNANNHFSEKYHENRWWNIPNLDKMEQSYKIAQEAYSRSGRKIINLTDNTALNVFKKDKLENWI